MISEYPQYRVVAMAPNHLQERLYDMAAEAGVEDDKNRHRYMTINRPAVLRPAYMRRDLARNLVKNPDGSNILVPQETERQLIDRFMAIESKAVHVSTDTITVLNTKTDSSLVYMPIVLTEELRKLHHTARMKLLKSLDDLEPLLQGKGFSPYIGIGGDISDNVRSRLLPALMAMGTVEFIINELLLFRKDAQNDYDIRTLVARLPLTTSSRQTS
jgi:2'-5' RNA ligase